MRGSIIVIGALVGVAIANDNLRRLSVNDQAANLIPTVTAAPDAAELKARQATSIGADEASVYAPPSSFRDAKSLTSPASPSS